MTTRSYWDNPSPEVEENRHQQLLDVYNTYYGTGGEDDPISPLVDGAVAQIEGTCRAIIESHGTLYSIINAHLGRRR
jgi:hypothetical protein